MLDRAAGSLLGAVFDLSHRAHYVHWHFFQMSWPNLIVIIVMIAVFLTAILAPFPKGRSTQ